MSLAEDLYERDFYAWTFEQADVLRRRAAGANALDWENLAEEVESLGREQLNACESLLRQIVRHFWKIATADEGQLHAVQHWRLEIIEFRLQIEAKLTPTLRLRLQEDAAEVIDRQLRAFKQLDRSLAADWRSDPPSLDQCLAEDWFPQPGARALVHAAAD